MKLLDIFKKHRWWLLAVVFLAAMPIWLFFVVPELLKIPADFSYKADVISTDNFYDPATDSFRGDQQSATKFSYEVVSGDSKDLTIKNIFDVRTLTGEKIFAVERLYGINAYSGAHVEGAGDRDREGYLFAPRMKGLTAQAPDKSPFTYWHINYNTPASMEFRSEEDLYGLPVYRYEANFNSDQTAELTGALPGVGKTSGITLDVHLELWVEPHSGEVVQYHDQADAYYYDLKTKERIQPWNRFSNLSAPTSGAAHASAAVLYKQKILIFNFIIPLFLFIFSVILLAVGASRVVIWKKLFDKIPDRFRLLMTPVGISLTILGTTIGAVVFSHSVLSQQQNSAFNLEVGRVNQLIIKRLEIYSNVLRGAKGLFDASSSVERDEWRAYVESLNLQSKYPGALGVGFSMETTLAEKEALIATVRADGFPSFNIFPEGKRDIYSVVIYLEPFDTRNQLAFGYDLLSDPVRRSAVQYARDSGDVSITGGVNLLQEAKTEVRPGFLMDLPVYKKGLPTRTVADRQAAIFGYVYMPFNSGDFMNGTLLNSGSIFDIEIFDTPGVENRARDTLLYQGLGSDLSNRGTSVDSKIEFGGRIWTVRYTAPIGYGLDLIRRGTPWIMGFLGLLLSSALFAATYALVTRREKAVAYANEVTKDLRAEKDKLAEAKAKDEAILYGIGDGVFAVGADYKITLFNVAATSISGFSEKEAVGAHYSNILKFIREKDGNAGDSFIKKTMESGKPHAMENHAILIAKNGSNVPVADSAAPIKDATGRTTGCVVVFRDVTKEKEIERAKDEFLSVASHQLRTPLSAMRWIINMVGGGDYGKLTKKQQEMIGELNTSTLRLISLVNDLLIVARVESGRVTIDPKPMDLITAVTSILAELKVLAKKKSLKVNLTATAGLPEIKLDPELFRQVAMNLVSNAINYTRKDGKVDVGLKLEGQEMILSVADNGIGIPREHQKQIFQKFFRAPNAVADVPNGSGLGLNIAKMLTASWNGRIWFVSEAGKGTTFFVSIPLVGSQPRKGEVRLGG